MLFLAQSKRGCNRDEENEANGVRKIVSYLCMLVALDVLLQKIWEFTHARRISRMATNRKNIRIQLLMHVYMLKYRDTLILLVHANGKSRF